MSPVTILKTKLFIPPLREGTISRPRLIELVNKNIEKKLLLISAPAGFGKTTLAASWLAQQEMPVAWVSLDEYDNDPLRFFSYILAAFCKINPKVGRKCSDILQSPNAPSLENLLVFLLNDLASLEQDYFLILDDYHLIHSQEVHETLAILLESQLPRLHFIIISRTEPNLPISKLRASNQLVVLSVNDLRFTQPEAENFLNQVMELSLSAEDVNWLGQQTEGWITGLQLSALSLRETRITPDVVQQISGDHRYIADYLFGEVLSNQPEHIQDFLLKTSILDRMSADVCNQILGIHNSQAILETLERSNLFMIPLDTTREWYRYHHLFAEMLRSRLEHFHAESIRQIYWQAFKWHQANELLEDAVRYGIAGEYFEQAAEIIENISNDIYWRNRAHTVQEWLDKLPEEFLHQRPNLRILIAYGSIDKGDIQGTEKIIKDLRNDLEERLIPLPKEYPVLEGKLSAIETAVLYHHYLDGKRGLKVTQRALELLPPEYQYDRCVAAFHGGGFFILTGELDQAQEYLKDALNWSTQLNNPLAKLLTLSNLGHLECVRGRLKLAEQYFLEAYQLAHEIKVRQGSTFSMAVIGLANLHYEWNDLQRAETLIAEGIKIVESGKFLDRLLLGYSSKIRIHNVQGEYDQALNAIQRINQLAILYNAPQKITERIEALSAIISLAEGSFPKAASWAARFSTNFRDEPSYENEFEIMILCKVLIAQEMYPAALDWLKKLLKLALEQGRFDSIIRIEVLLAKVYYLQDEVEKALEQIQQALILAEAGNYQRVFLDEGFTIKMLLTQLFQSRNRDQHIKISSDYIGNLLGAFTAESLPIESDGQHPLMQLTNRELDVLKFLATGLSYAALAEKLNITENTVRTHVKNIYGKLGVNNRTQALLEAKKLDLL